MQVRLNIRNELGWSGKICTYPKCVCGPTYAVAPGASYNSREGAAFIDHVRMHERRNVDVWWIPRTVNEECNYGASSPAEPSTMSSCCWAKAMDAARVPDEIIRKQTCQGNANVGTFVTNFAMPTEKSDFCSWNTVTRQQFRTSDSFGRANM